MTVDAVRAELLVEDGELREEESTLSKQRKNISVYNTVETLNKHPSIFINYLRVLAGLKGIKFQIQAVPEEQKGQPKKSKTKKNAKIEQILTAKDLTYEEFEELSLKKRAGRPRRRRTCRLISGTGRISLRPPSSRRRPCRTSLMTKTPSRTSLH